MNPHAKEFVPAHLMKRHDEADELTKKIDQVYLNDSNNRADDDKNQTSGGGDSTNKTTTTTTTAESAPSSTNKNNISKSQEENDSDQTSEKQHNHQNNITSEHSDKNHLNKTNGTRSSSNNDQDSHLLKAGETFCEFNGEQFIIPGEEDEEYNGLNHESNNKCGYDFGNVEDNEDEDVCNAYEQFLDNLPE